MDGPATDITDLLGPRASSDVERVQLPLEHGARLTGEVGRQAKQVILRVAVQMPDAYDINLNVKYGQLTVIDVAAEAASHEPWFNQTLTTVNDAVVRLGVLEGDFHWHKHDEEDEFFLVLEGELVIEVEGSDTVRLGPHQGYTVPRGVMHKTSAPKRSVIVMVEPAAVVPTGD